jgi:hypothetical protein
MTGYDAATNWSQSDPLLKSHSLLPLTRFANLAGPRDLGPFGVALH